MINLVNKQNAMPEQAPDVRNTNCLEVCTGYTEDMAVREAMRCLRCRKKPCVSGCPVNIKIPDFIAKVAEGDFEAAYEIISEDSSLPAICGRVCPQENQCQGQCVQCAKGESVAIGRLERFVADWHAANFGDEEIAPVESNGHKVAIIGAGPAGLVAANQLNRKGYTVTVFDKNEAAGGLLRYGIPNFKLGKNVIDRRIKVLEEEGIVFKYGCDIDCAKLPEGFDAYIIATGTPTARD